MSQSKLNVSVDLDELYGWEDDSLLQIIQEEVKEQIKKTIRTELKTDKRIRKLIDRAKNDVVSRLENSLELTES
jgi:pyruvate/2-oxoacid:ferredoxin oxidoreductase beta subunit